MRGLQGLVRLLKQSIKPIIFIFRLLQRILETILGSLSWQPPHWPQIIKYRYEQVYSWARAHRRTAWQLGIGIFLVLTASLGAWWWYDHLPKPIEVTFQVNNPPCTRLEDENAKPEPLRVHFNRSVALLANAGKEIKSGIEISPKLEGRWQWVGDRDIEFRPKGDWPVGEEFTVSLDKKGFIAEHVRLANYKFNFKTASFVANAQQAQFHQDPVDPNLKKVVISINFSHPVEPSELEKRVTLRQEGQSTGVLGIGGETAKFNVTYDKLKLNAYLHSDPISIPKKDTFMEVTVDEGVQSARGGPGTKQKLRQKVRIPGLYSLAIQQTNLTLVNNERYEPEQVMVVETSETVHEKDMQKNISAFVLPIYHPDTNLEQRKRAYNWYDPSKIGPEILKESEALKLDAVPAEREYTSLHSFKYQADVGRYVYLKVEKGIKSFGGYVLGDTVSRIIKVPPFPKELKIMQNGSLLPMSHEKKLAIFARDIPAIQFEVGRLLPNQLQHLVTQSSGSFGNPQFYSGEFNEANLTERFTQIVELPKLAPGKPHYTSIDLGKYLDNEGSSRRGLFFLKAQGYDPVKKRVIGGQDSRLILVSDLGLLAKKAVDGSQDIFVQSIFSGDPIAAATVEIVGKNGITVLSQITNNEGHARFPSLKEFNREKTPAMIVVKKAGDMSFLPMNRHDRLLDISRFDIGGVANSAQADRLSAYLFSNRGIYRPGDTFHVGMIVKGSDWAKKLAGLPLEAQVTDARGLVLKREKIRLSEAGFEELNYTTSETSPTGNYTVNLYTVRDGYPYNLLGSTAVKVEEFQPDRMKMTANLSTQVVEGWVSPQDLRARINLQNLFGTPATNRRVTASMSLSPAYPYFPSYKDYSFYDPQRAKNGVDERLPEVKTDEKGEAEFDLNLHRFARATYRLHFVANGFEAEGGRSVAAETASLVSPLPFLVGFKRDGDLDYINKDAKRSVNLIAINPQAKKIAVDKLTLTHLEYRYVSVLTKQDNGTYKYESKKKEIKLDSKSLSVPANGLNYDLPTAAPGKYAFVISDTQGLELNRIEYNIAGHANLTRSLEKNAELQLSLNKKDYTPGEEIEMQIKAPYVGSGLITIERERVHHHRWFKTNTTSSVQKIKLPSNFEGNGYISVSFIRDASSDEIYMSPLSFGVVPFSVSLEKRKNTITLQHPDLVKPSTAFKVKYKTEHPGRIVIFGVDEGILQVAGYKTPDPLGFFFQKRALEVSTSQILDLILPEFKRLMLAAAPGGDEAGALGKHLNPFKRKRDKPVAFWSGIIESGPKEKEYVYQVPDYFNGTLRVMAVAVSDEAIGATANKSLVRGDFVLNPNVPTTVAPGDEFDISVGVTNNVPGSGNGHDRFPHPRPSPRGRGEIGESLRDFHEKEPNVTVSLKTSAHVEVLGSDKVDLKIGELREAPAVFKIRAKEKLGSANFTFTATMGDKSGKFSTDTSVRPSVPYMTSLAIGNFKDGKQEVAVTRDMYSEYRTLQAGISHVPLLMGQGLISYLQAFPYTCTEQLVSQGMPAVILAERLEFGITKAAQGSSLAGLIGTLRSRQNSEGAFGLWAANHYVNDFVSIYAMHFLLEARERGHLVPQDLITNGNNYLQQLAGSESKKSDEASIRADERARAYAIYLLTRQGVVTTNYAAALQKRVEEKFAKTWKQDLIAVYLAASYQLMKQERLADNFISKAKFGSTDIKGFVHYYDDLIHNSQLLYIIAKHFPQRLENIKGEAIANLVKPIQQNLYNTLSSSYTLLALDAVVTATGDKDGTTKFAINEILRNGKIRALALPKSIMPRVDFSSEAAKLQFSSSSDFPAFYLVSQSGFDRQLPKKDIKNGFEVLREYTDTNGKPISTVKLGEEIEVHLKFRSLSEILYNTAIVDLLPGGFEPVIETRVSDENFHANVRARPSSQEQENNTEGEGESEGERRGDNGYRGGWMPRVGTSKSNWQPDYADVREDRIVLYGTVNKNVSEFVYRIKATNAGTYIVPPTFGESMYERSIQARSLGGKIMVEKK